MWDITSDTSVLYLCVFAYLIIVLCITCLIGLAKLSKGRPLRKHDGHLASKDIMIYILNMNQSLLRMKNDHMCMLSRTQQRLLELENKIISRCDTNKYRPAEPTKCSFDQDEEIKRLQAVIFDLTEEKELLEHSLEEKMERLSHLEESMAMKESAMKKLDEDLFRADELSCELSEKVSELNIKLSQTANNRDLLSKENADLKTQLIIFKEQIKTLTSQLEDYQDAFTTMALEQEKSSDGQLMLKVITTEIRHEEMDTPSLENI